MSTPIWTTYRHMQRAPLCVILYAIAAALFVSARSARLDPLAPIILSVAGVIVLILAASFHHLTVADEGDRLAVAFGPLPLFRTTIPYEDMRAVEIGRTTALEGWGIHMSLRGGWVWNIWGRDCVVVHRRRGVIRIGSDDAENLAAFLLSRITDDQT